MSGEVEVLVCGEIVAHGESSDLWSAMSDEITVYTTDDGVLMLAVGDDGGGMAMGIDPDTGDVCITACEVTYRYQGERRRKHARTAMVDVPVHHMTRFLVRALRALGVDLGPDVKPPLDESAIRADERAKVEAEVVALLEAKSREVEGGRAGDLIAGALLAMTWGIRTGKRRSTP